MSDGKANSRTETIAIVGPTAVGKTAVAIEIADRLNAEIISVDSRQIYREMNIGTAKPTALEQMKITHHFIGELNLGDSTTAAKFAARAHERIDALREKGKSAVIAGGSTLYLHAVLFGLDEVPSTPPDVRRRLKKRLEVEGLDVLAVRLKRVDPDTAKSIDVQNPRRVLRALEVYEITGRPLSSFHRSSEAAETPAFPLFVLSRDREDLYDRINRRVDRMLEADLIEEVASILDSGHSPALPVLQTIGYAEVSEFLAGRLTRGQMEESIKRNTRRYAKRQLTWFRRYESAHWIHVNEEEQAGSVAHRILKKISAGWQPEA